MGFNNIGNRLQNYAVQNILEKKNCDVTTIYYSVPYYKKFSAMYFVEFFRNLCIKTKLILSLPYAKYIKKDNKMYLSLEFNKKYVKISTKYLFKSMKMKKYASDFDKWCVGSDQIWNFIVVRNFDFFFLKFAEKRNTFSFAASFGAINIPDENMENFRKGLSHIGNISVREDEGAKLVSDIVQRDAEVLLDPTLLMDSNDWLKVARKPDCITDEKFIVLYFLGGMSEEQKKFIYKYAQNNDYKIIDMYGANYDSVGPSEFIWAVANSEFVFTDSFHASAFSVNFKKKFIVFKRNNIYDMSSRIVTLVNKFKINECFYQGDADKISGTLHDFVDKINNLDFSHIDSILDEEKRKADLFLNKVLTDDGD